MRKWERLRQSSKRKEETGDRILLAERLRRELETITGSYTSNIHYNLDEMPPAEAHAKYVNTLIPGINIPSDMEGAVSTEDFDTIDIFEGKDSLRIVIVSDTHGCERSLSTDDFEPWIFTNSDEEVISQTVGHSDQKLLPNGDILLHLGDFAVDRGGIARRKALEKFDSWLATQTHPVKIIVRGNHDPYNVEFPISQAKYVTKPTSFTLGGKVLAVVPFGHAGFAASKLKRSYSHLLPSKNIDILATHEPPHNILDKCISGDRAGNSLIRLAVENMKELPPKLWVCGHIHEGRGSMRTTFGSKKQESRETLVINAANANPGRAHHLDYGPVVVDVSNESDIVEGSKDMRIERKTSSIQKRQIQENEQELLLAVDLGLKCGASLFDDSGKLLRYEQLRFSDPKDLYEQAPKLIDSWENNINYIMHSEDTANSQAKKKVITYLAVEGGGELFDAWETAIDTNEKRNQIQLVSVRPEEWRSRLLLPKERQSSRTCKEAARLIARQVVAECGERKHEGKFKTDAAESVSMGYYLANQLGWIKREPILNRYTNGKIVVPN